MKMESVLSSGEEEPTEGVGGIAAQTPCEHVALCSAMVSTSISQGSLSKIQFANTIFQRNHKVITVLIFSEKAVLFARYYLKRKCVYLSLYFDRKTT